MQPTFDILLWPESGHLIVVAWLLSWDTCQVSQVYSHLLKAWQPCCCTGEGCHPCPCQLVVQGIRNRCTPWHPRSVVWCQAQDWLFCPGWMGWSNQPQPGSKCPSSSPGYPINVRLVLTSPSSFCQRSILSYVYCIARSNMLFWLVVLVLSHSLVFILN